MNAETREALNLAAAWAKRGASKRAEDRPGPVLPRHLIALAAELARMEEARDPDYSPAYQDEYQRLWHRDAAYARIYRQAFAAIEAVRIPSDGQKDATERAYFDVKAIALAALKPETPRATILGVQAAIETQDALLTDPALSRKPAAPEQRP